ncbi:hypothetical protein U1Q18_051509, partial [Sarracenia purpurea var. burkii]
SLVVLVLVLDLGFIFRLCSISQSTKPPNSISWSSSLVDEVPQFVSLGRRQSPQFVSHGRPPWSMKPLSEILKFPNPWVIL